MGLQRRIFRAFLPSALLKRTGTVPFDEHLIQLKGLRRHLLSVGVEPCRIDLVTGASDSPDTTVQAFLRYGGRMASPEEVRNADNVLFENAKLFSEKGLARHLCEAVSLALALDADFLLVEETEAAIANVAKDFGFLVGDFAALKRNCELFVRGHEVPWAFSQSIVGVTWKVFYVMCEPDRTLANLYAVSEGDSDLKELARSIYFNRYSALCYTRDKLLFYLQQELALKRNKIEPQDFMFELGYYLNHYYLLFWAGLGRLCWLINHVFQLGFRTGEFRSVGPLAKTFRARLAAKAPAVSLLFQSESTDHWLKLLRAGRHIAAHRGFLMPQEVLIAPEKEPTDRELEDEVLNSADGQLLDILGDGDLRKSLLEMMKFNARLLRYRRLDTRVLAVELDGQEVLFDPLIAVQWNFDNFIHLADGISSMVLEHLDA